MKPMLAGTLKDLADVKYPTYVTPKLDGIRCLTHNGQAVSRTLKPIRNQFVQDQLKGLPDGLDGELVLTHNAPFNEVSSAIMSGDGEPDFVYMIFDFPGWGAADSYLNRVQALAEIIEDEAEEVKGKDRLYVLEPAEAMDEEDLLKFEEDSIEKGFEGIMLRTCDGPYKYGRSTIREGYLLKLKRHQDGEAEVIGYEEQLHNGNVGVRNALGRTERSSAKAGMVRKGVLGALKVKDLKTGVEFDVGTGFNDNDRAVIWADRCNLIGKIVKYKHWPSGAKEKPRFPVWLGFRDKEDM